VALNPRITVEAVIVIRSGEGKFQFLNDVTISKGGYGLAEELAEITEARLVLARNILRSYVPLTSSRQKGGCFWRKERGEEL